MGASSLEVNKRVGLGVGDYEYVSCVVVEK